MGLPLSAASLAGCFLNVIDRPLAGAEEGGKHGGSHHRPPPFVAAGSVYAE